MNQYIDFLESSLFRSSLSYPTHDSICSIFTGRSDSRRVNLSKAPHAPATPPELLPVTQALRTMPEKMRSAVVWKHIETGSERTKAVRYSHEQGCSVPTYYKRVDSAYWYILGSAQGSAAVL